MGAENLGEAVIVDIAVNGLKPSLKQTVIQKSPKTFEQLRNSLEIATNVAECAKTMKSAVKQEVSQVMAVTPNSMPTQNFEERQETRQYRQDYVCFGCGKSCTNRRLCPAFNVKCFKCDRVGHFKEVCGLNLRSYPRSNNRQPHPSQGRNFNSRHPNSSAKGHKPIQSLGRHSSKRQKRQAQTPRTLKNSTSFGKNKNKQQNKIPEIAQLMNLSGNKNAN
ncbi:unnamed protein product [Mytilus edulis]|uniref:CCHC-type domain-containing protein n=1 Tax=Mytilus edulis TaxID=6550 RepID=A0A8S3VH01_MYTED|nr:unnamed protein product [Mytilus edulis]